MTDDEIFYTYTENGFLPIPSPLKYRAGDGEDLKDEMEKNGWIERNSHGAESVMEITVYTPKDNDDGSRMVELWDTFSRVWICLVPVEHWPRFMRDEIMPVIRTGSIAMTEVELNRISNAVISIGRHGIGQRDIDRYTGESLIDARLDREKRGR